MRVRARGSRAIMRARGNEGKGGKKIRKIPKSSSPGVFASTCKVHRYIRIECLYLCRCTLSSPFHILLVRHPPDGGLPTKNFDFVGSPKILQEYLGVQIKSRIEIGDKWCERGSFEISQTIEADLFLDVGL